MRLECGEGRAGENLELEGLDFVLEIWQNSRREYSGSQARFGIPADTSFEVSRTRIHCHAVGAVFSNLLALLGTYPEGYSGRSIGLQVQGCQGKFLWRRQLAGLEIRSNQLTFGQFLHHSSPRPLLLGENLRAEDLLLLLHSIRRRNCGVLYSWLNC
jgi:hypothetical protein